jgi:hypothetical protein
LLQTLFGIEQATHTLAFDLSPDPPMWIVLEQVIFEWLAESGQVIELPSLHRRFDLRFSDPLNCLSRKVRLVKPPYLISKHHTGISC